MKNALKAMVAAGIMASGFVGLLVCPLTNINAQGVGINPSGNPPDPSAIFDASATNKGMLMPRLTTTQRDAITNPAQALLIFNTTTNCFEAYVNSAWSTVSCPCPSISAPTSGTHTPSATQIVWNWNIVSGSSGYKYNTVNNYFTATDNGASISFTQTGLTVNTTYMLYVWAYNSCGYSSYVTLTSTTPLTCGLPITDSRDNKIYNTVLIGAQCWMAQNLNYGTYEALPASGAQPSGYKYCETIPGGVNDPTCANGGLYEWINLMNGSSGCNGSGAPPNDRCATVVQGLCPSGWHVPSHYEWTTLEKNVGSNPGAFPYDELTIAWLGTDEGSNLKSQTGWNSGGNGTNNSGFNALPCGGSVGGAFSNAGIFAVFWSATDSGSNVWERDLYAPYATESRYKNDKGFGFSVRCVKN